MKSQYLSVIFFLVAINLTGQGIKPEIQKNSPEKIFSEEQTSSNSSGMNIKPGEIIFPNAFKWNGTGPTGGYWSDHNVDDYVFRPFQNNVTNYKLKIYTRNGALIYESTDIYKGWDGYSKTGDLAVQGVYVWMARGKFSDGGIFNKIGDVTFLH